MVYNSPFKIDNVRETFNKLSGIAGVIVFGTGNCGILVLEALKKENIEVICLSDNNKTRWGQFFNGHKVVSPAELKHTNN